jgi:lysophospholipase L1-like esterase
MSVKGLAAGCLASWLAGVAAAAPAELWVGAWGFPPSPVPLPVTQQVSTQHYTPPAPLDNRTIRQVLRLATAAKELRLRVSNEFGVQALLLGEVHVALAADDGAIVEGSDHAVTFAGSRSATVPAGAPLLSDPIDWNLPALTKLAVSVFVPEHVPSSGHLMSSYVSEPGDSTTATRLPGAQAVRFSALLSSVEVLSPTACQVVVTLGDSITEGFGSSSNAFKGWSDLLADRLNNNTATRSWSVVNAGINSNRLLHNNPGMSALARFDRDVLAVPGVHAVVLMEGINDIGYSQTRPDESETAEQIIAAYQQLIARAHEHGLLIIGATLTPFRASHYYDEGGERMRQSVNAWIRTKHVFDAVLDFDAVMRDASDPSSVAADLHHGDHLHPNDAGYSRMADSIDLKTFQSQRCSRK